MDQKRDNVTGLLSVAPAFLMLAVFLGYPIIRTFYQSFTIWDGLNSEFIGWDNYISIFSNGDLLLLLRNNVLFLLSVPVILLITLVVTILLFEQVPGWRLFRSLYYLPSVLSAVVIGFLAKSMFSTHGLVNTTLQKLGLGNLVIDWFNYVPTAFLIIILCFYLQTLGQGVLIFLSGMSVISQEVFEAGKIDGANWFQRLYHFVIPALIPTIFYFTITNMIYVFIGLFGLVYSITGGGPGYETTPIDYMIYLKAFQSGKMGYASALSVVLFIIVFIMAWVQLKIQDRIHD
ncbi:carbohydrate ABC transporter permease [Paenibacillus nasutitermitis]|uniref:ABC transporter permease n=1 Tax=Paenibacillus nasutitermitis TaxID=1652958 RepID=A0A916ZH80_9BACL|nr:sugar ABC transporter permease [Paenibacillus nasutitermitis]GGD96752.1 ABC transporter permease [Paenibacillus nasutitermitis]